jgi:Fibronectin type III domain
MIKNILKMKYCSLLLILLSLIACSNDDNNLQGSDDNDPQENMPLGDFTVTVDSITAISAQINWSIPENGENTDVSYSIYLNETLQQENLSVNTFLIENLISETDYSVRIEAHNEFETVSDLANFTTLEIPDFYITKIASANNTSIFSTITYREDKQIEGVLNSSPGINLDYSYTYNEQGMLTLYAGGDTDFGVNRASYIYSGNTIDEINAYYGFADARTDEVFNYNPDLTSYTYKRTFDNPGGVHIQEESDNFIERDVQNRLIQHTKINTTANTETTYFFEYENENLTKISDGEGNIWEIVYDDYTSFITFYSGYRGGRAFSGGVAAGFSYTYDNNLHDDLRNMPDFWNYRNKNNPVEIRKNGAVLGTFQYEYNELEYPIEMTYDNGYTLEFEYTQL